MVRGLILRPLLRLLFGRKLARVQAIPLRVEGGADREYAYKRLNGVLSAIGARSPGRLRRIQRCLTLIVVHTRQGPVFMYGWDIRVAFVSGARLPDVLDDVLASSLVSAGTRAYLEARGMGRKQRSRIVEIGNAAGGLVQGRLKRDQ